MTKKKTKQQVKPYHKGEILWAVIDDRWLPQLHRVKFIKEIDNDEDGSLVEVCFQEDASDLKCRISIRWGKPVRLSEYALSREVENAKRYLRGTCIRRCKGLMDRISQMED